MRDCYIKFFNKAGELEETAMFSEETDKLLALHNLTENSLLDALEEALYIAAELTPEDYRNWKRELSTYQFTTFTYHMTEFFYIDYPWDESGIFEVREK